MIEEIASGPAAIPAAKRGSSIGAQILALAWRAADFRIGLAVLAFLILASLLGPSVLGLSATKMDVANRFAPPIFLEGGTWKHILGTDQLGRDLLIRSLIGLRNALLIGTVLAVVGFVLLAVVSSQKSFFAFLPGTILAGAGVIIVSIPFGNLIIKEAPPAQYGPVTSSRTTIGQFWYSIGFAISTVLVDKLTLGGVTGKLTEADVQPDMISTAISSVTTFVKTGDEPTTQIGKEALADAVSSYASGYTTVMLISAALMLLAGIVAALLLRKADAAAEGPAKTDPAMQLVTAAAPAAVAVPSATSSTSGQAHTSQSDPSKE